MQRKNKKEEPDKSILFRTPRPQKEFEGKSPDVLIGSFGYPFVNTGALVGPHFDEAKNNPQTFLSQQLDIPNIIQQRQSLINSIQKTKVQSIPSSNKFIEQTQEIAKSSQAVDTAITLQKPLLSRVEFHQRSLPHGPSASLQKLSLTSNPFIAKPVERLTSDTDSKAHTAIQELLQKGISTYKITSLLSAGTLGQGTKRKLVPTKWSITATDDTIGEHLRKKLIDFSFLNDYQAYTGSYLGNGYVILLLPGEWSFELIEYTFPHTIYNSQDTAIVTKDHEFLQGRKTYAQETAGGYYAARLAVLEQLHAKKRQARVLVLRFITPQYTAPLGVWTLRETIKWILQSKQSPQKRKEQANKKENTTTNPAKKSASNQSSYEELLQEAVKLIKQYELPEPQNLLQLSVILKQHQTSINRWKKSNVKKEK